MTRPYICVVAWAFALFIACCLQATNAVYLQHASDDRVVFGNQFVRAIFNPANQELSELYGDFEGSGNFTTNVLSKPFRLVVGGSRAAVLQSHSKPTVTSAVSSAKDLVQITSMIVHDFVEEEWTFTVAEQSREVQLSVSGRITADFSATYLSYGLYLDSPSLYGLFDVGMMQMMGRSASCLGSEEPISRAYFLGNNAALDVIIDSTTNTPKTSQTTLTRPSTVVFRSDVTGKDSFHSAVELQVAGSSYPHLNRAMSQAWSSRCWSDANVTVLSTDNTPAWALNLRLLPNNGNFPVYSVKDILDKENMGSASQAATHLLGIYPSAAGCLQGYYDQQQGTAAPTIAHPDVGYSPDTNFFDPDNFLTLSSLLFSGDEYLLQEAKLVLERTAQTMCGLGSDQDLNYCSVPRQRLRHQPYHTKRHNQLHSERKNPPNPSAESEKVELQKYDASQRAGQLMHHYISLQPTYASIAGSEQLGPNIFWTLCALRYISLTQDAAWALQFFPFIDLSTKFVLSFVDKERMMVSAPGPLWIDVLVREHYTSDSNAMLVYLLSDLADYYDLVHLLDKEQTHGMSWLETTATELRTVAEQVSQSMVKELWATTNGTDYTNANVEGDHFVTQKNPDGSIRDFVDYDSNLIAVAAGVLAKDLDKQQKLLRRVDSGPNTHIRATWCSEIAYTGDRCDCYIVGGSVCGDSVVTLARIGWMDALARHKTGDVDTYHNLILQPLQTDLARDTWLSERYDSSGTQIRTPYYFEYPALVTMLLREVSVGLNLQLLDVSLQPIDASSKLLYQVGSFSNNAGSTGNSDTQKRSVSSAVSVDSRQSPQKLTLRLPGDASVGNAWPRRCQIHYLATSSHYLLTTTSSASDTTEEEMLLQTDDKGVLTFTATFTAQKTFTLTLQSAAK